MTDESKDETAKTPVPKGLRFLAWLVVLTALLLVAGIAGFKYSSYANEGKLLAADVEAGPLVHVVKLKKGMGEHRVTLTGETRPYESATLYAKVSGYLKKVVVDKGDVVDEGSVLAVIESPETDEAYLAAEADSKNKLAILQRMQTLFQKQLVSQQEFDQAQADAEVSTAKLRAEKTLKGYETLKAPFRGTITARYADPGALIQNATSSDTSALPVLMISEIKRLRIDVFIDQRDAPYIQKDDAVIITLPERPEFKMDGKVARITNELDPRTKMLLTEIDINNESNALVAGSFVQVSLLVKSPPYVEAPVEALVLKDDKTYLTSVTDGDTLTYKAVTIGTNDGKILTIIAGGQEGDRIALNVGTTLPEGSKIRPIEKSHPSPTPAPAEATALVPSSVNASPTPTGGSI